MRTYFVYGRVHGEEKKRKERRGIQWESLWELGTGTGRTPIMTITGTTLCVPVPSWAMRLGSMRMHNTQSLQVATLSLELPVGVRWEDITRYVFACFYCSSLSLLLSDCTSVRASIKLDPECAALERKGGSNVASNCTRLNVARNCLLSEYLVFSIDIPNFCRDPCSIIPRSSPHDTSLLASKLFLGR